MAAQHVTDTNFDHEVLNSDVPVLVDFWAPECGPCRMMGPTVDELANEFEGRAKVVKANVHEAPVAAARYNVLSIPSFVLVQNGEAKGQWVGARPKQDLAGPLESLAN